MNYRTLISAQQLAPHIDEPAWLIFDCRHDLADPEAGERAYRAGHIPGAQLMHLERDLSGEKTGANGRHPLPAPANFAALLAHRGVSHDTQVVAYDDVGGAYAARLWWMLRWLGHNKVAVLDGGLAAWQRAGNLLTDVMPAVTPGRFAWRASTPIVDTGYVFAHLQRPDMLLIDARSPERFRGDNETIDPIGGHIPGAINRFFKDNLAADGCFKPAPVLRRELEQLLAGRSSSVVVSQCGSGVTACHNLMALEIAGLHGARLYPGSWSEWCHDPKRPVSTLG